jgi:hypothetical protein
MAAPQTVSRARKRPARTPPSTFLFLPIHLSNSPEPCGPVAHYGRPQSTPEPPKPAHPTWPKAHDRMNHSANREGLLKTRHRATRRRAKTAYIGFWRRDCQRPKQRKRRCGGGKHRQLRGAAAGRYDARRALELCARRFRRGPDAALRPHSSAVLCRNRVGHVAMSGFATTSPKLFKSSTVR